MTKISLILTTHNSRDNLEKTLKSIEIQSYPDIEVVIKDGGSTDGTIDIIRNYQETSKHTVIWETKPDSGIYDAMNQGYKLCSGDVILFFNDEFIDSQAVKNMMEVLEKHPECVGAHADLVYMDGEKVVRRWEMGEGSIEQGWMPGHPTLFLKREIYEKYGLYNTSFKIAADYEFMIRFLKDKENQLAYYPNTIVSMFYGGTSNGGLGYFVSLKEGHKALKMNGIRHSSLIDIKRSIRVLRQFERHSSKIAIDLLWLRPGGVGGTEFFVRNLLDGFLTLPDRYQFVLLLSKDNEDSFDHYLEDERFEKVVANVYSKNIGKRIIWQFLFQNHLLRKNGIRYCFSPVYVRPVFNGGVEYLSVIHDIQVYHYPQYHPFYERWYTKLCWQADKWFSKHIVASSKYVKKELIDIYKIKEEKVSQIYIPVIIDPKKACGWEQINLKYGVERESYYYTISQAIPHKNLETIIKVMACLRDEGSNKDIKLLISGISGNATHSINELVGKYNLKDNIIFTGFISNEEKTALLQNCKLFLFPSVFEGFGIPPIEAMMCGAKVITTRCTCIPEVTQERAIYVNDSYSVAEWMEKIEESESYSNEKIGFERYDKQIIAKEYIDILKKTFNIK